MSDDEGWGGGGPKKRDVFEETDPIELMRLQTMHLQRIRGYLGFIVLVIVLNSIALTLWLAGVIEVTTSTTRSPFG